MALGLTMIVLVAVLPQLITGLRATALAGDVTRAKGVTQAQLERMRSRPFHVAPSAERRIDVLDTYYPDLVPPTSAPGSCMTGGAYTKPAVGWSGYVSDTTRCSYEPTTGDFYRKVEESNEGGRSYVIVTDTQFLRSGTANSGSFAPVVALRPTSGYDSKDPQGLHLDFPVTPQIGVTVTVFYVSRARLRPVTTYTEIAEERRDTMRAQGKSSVSALGISSANPSGQSLVLTAGGVDLGGSLSRASNASASLTAAATRKVNGDATGALLGPVYAPGDGVYTYPGATDADGDGLDGTCTSVCWGSTDLATFTSSAASGRPTVGASTSPVEARISALTPNTGISFKNTPDPSGYDASLQLKPLLPLASLVATSPQVTASACGTSRGGAVTGRGYLTTTDSQVDSCAEAATSKVSLFPTSFAPDGVVRLTLSYASARCTVSRSNNVRSATASYRYRAEVEIKKPGGDQDYYPAYVLVGDSSSRPATDVLQAHLGDPVATGVPLSTYIDSWSSPTTATVGPAKTTSTTATATAEATVPGVITMLSKKLRPADPSSVVSLSLGTVGCYAEDSR